MSIRGNKTRADALVEEVLAERRARRAHGARAKAIFVRRLGSPGGLAACFGAGAVTGLRLGAGEPAGEVERQDGVPPDDASERGFLERFSDSPLGNIALRLAAATIVRYLLTSGGDGNGGGAAGEPADDLAAAGGH